ncbi:YifB family Mg chelatase-like AAA ATPase [Auritidibacter ignavus]|uniref:YifB family Mg chelatase-like AAA ATPase n=1 Tax=Auritidibacter ignavus TaxID=678932 RepID=A0AAJ6AMB5_9MICC|nr:YifB family Mg chelatase-like AAA ATPase [Auritidibacter ignavus]WGH93473.1 YifB family Mg chelatase-like AAA ATPase [Auritidibacter ignavus]
MNPEYDNNPASATADAVLDSMVLNVTEPARIGRTYAMALSGLHGELVTVEADIGGALPGFTLVGLPDQSLNEAKDRIRAAARNSGMPITRRHLTVNLTPAGLHKSGPLFDLAIVMAAYGAEYRVNDETGPVFLAALGLDGTLQHVPGLLAAVLAAQKAGFDTVVVAEASKKEAELVSGVTVLSYRHLSAVLEDFGAAVRSENFDVFTASAPDATMQEPDRQDELDFAEVAGQHHARWALEVAAAGGHHLLFQGPPGSGKTMLAQRLPTILPHLDEKVSLETTAIHSLASSQAKVIDSITTPPFQAPHHTASLASVIGGGTRQAQPGAISLAHGGVLFLDEAPEFDRRVLEALREPLENRHIELSRLRHNVIYPASFQLLLAANPCPCGWGYAGSRRCSCTSAVRRRYNARLSGPLLDRIDILVRLHPVTSRDLNRRGMQPESSATIRQRVLAARARQAERLKGTGVRVNAEMNQRLLHHPSLSVSPSARAILDRSLDRGEITARGYSRILKVAWTLADLAEQTHPGVDEIDMAFHLKLWGSEHDR